MKYTMLLIFSLLITFFEFRAFSDDAIRSLASITNNKSFTVNVNGATAENVVKMIAKKADVNVQIDGDLSKRVSYNFTDITLDNAMAKMASDVGFEYYLQNNTLFVSKISDAKSSKAKGIQNVNLIELNYVDADEMADKLKTLIRDGEEIHIDRKQNALIIVGSKQSFERAKKFIALFDRMPKQIMIEAKIVATNNNFSRELGFQLGDLTEDSDLTLNADTKTTGFSAPSATSTSPVLGLKYRLSTISGRSLDMRLLAAETKGDAKVISRPKVVTINNTKALINSGVVFNVKTLSNVSTTSSTTTTSSTSSVAGGLERVEAGLQLGVLPTIVDNSLVKLVVDVNNSEPDTQIEVDGIPSISTNSANTSIIVENGGTAVIAGLIKNSNSHARSGVPFLSDIPILGLLFRADGETTRNNELMIFITPTVLPSPGTLKSASVK